MPSLLLQNKVTTEVIKALFLTTLLIVLFWPSLVTLVYAWEIKPQCSHGYFIVPISLWLGWKKKDELMSASVIGSYWGVVLLFSGIVLYWLAIISAFDTLANLTLMVCIAGIIIGVWGTRVFRIVLFPFLFLVFMFPIPDVIYLSMTNPLKMLASQLSAMTTQAIGIPTLQEGNLLVFANFQLEVVEACSGMRSLMTYLMLSTLLAQFSGFKIFKKIVLILCAIPIAILINVIRIALTAILSEEYGTETAMGFFHGFTGVFVFAIGFGLLLLSYKLLSLTPRRVKIA